MAKIIELSHIKKQYITSDVVTNALDDISFSVKSGEFVAIVGPSGSGKSTLMHILGALDLPTSGTYKLDNHLVSSLSDDELARIRNQKIGFVFQAFNLLPRTNAIKNVMLPLAYAGVPKTKREETAAKFLTMVGLADRMHHTGAQLSGGQQQRVAIARALVTDPAIILADEPTGNIATAQAEEIMKIFQDLNHKGHTIVMITHEPDIAAHAGRVITIRDGHLISDQINHHPTRAGESIKNPISTLNTNKKRSK